MQVVALAVQLYRLGLEVGADLGEDRSECFDSLAIQDAVAAFGNKDQMDVHCRSAMPTVSKVQESPSFRKGRRSTPGAFFERACGEEVSTHRFWPLRKGGYEWQSTM